MNKADNVSYVSSTQGSARLPVGAVHLVRDGQGEPLLRGQLVNQQFSRFSKKTTTKQFRKTNRSVA